MSLSKSKFRVGKYAGKRGIDVPQAYLDWCLKTFYPKSLEYRIAKAVSLKRKRPIPENQFDYEARKEWFTELDARRGHEELDRELDEALGS